MAPSALAKPSARWGGCSCEGPPARAAAGLGLGLGRVAMPCTSPAYTPRFAASGLKPPKSSCADEVGVHTQAFPTHSTPPKPSPCQQWATNRQWVATPFFRSGVKMLVCANSNIFTTLSGGGGDLPPPFIALPRHPHDPSTTPRRGGLSRWTTPPPPVHPYPPPRPQHPVVHPHQQKPESPYRTLRGDEEAGVKVWGVGASQDCRVPWQVQEGPRSP